jgi:taurine dioxygenase
MGLSIAPLSDVLGAEVTGIDLREPVGGDTVAALNRAFAEHGVLVFRDQSLTAQQFLDAARLFGAPMRQKLTQYRVPDCPDVSMVSSQAKTDDGKPKILGVSWHTDHSFQPEPPKATLLCAVSLPDKGGDTSWADMRAAYDGLPADLRQEIENLQAVHAYTESRVPPTLDERKREKPEDVADGVVHPLVRTHPETGRKAIYINPLRMRRFLGKTAEDCAALIERLMQHATQPAFVYTHTWRAGDMVIWDNRSTIHKAETNYDLSQHRLMHRVILSGEKPV